MPYLFERGIIALHSQFGNFLDSIGPGGLVDLAGPKDEEVPSQLVSTNQPNNSCILGFLGKGQTQNREAHGTILYNLRLLPPHAAPGKELYFTFP